MSPDLFIAADFDEPMILISVSDLMRITAASQELGQQLIRLHAETQQASERYIHLAHLIQQMLCDGS